MSLTGELLTLVGAFALALVVRLVVAGVADLSYSGALVSVGFLVSVQTGVTG